MNVSKINYVIDLILLICFIVVTLSGIILFLNSGSFMVLGLNKIAWLKMHTLSGFLFTLLVVIHLILHLKWLSVMTKSFFKK